MEKFVFLYQNPTKIAKNAGKKAKKAKKKKDPNAPKKAPTPFFIFLAEERPKLKAQGKKKMRN